MAVVCAIIYSLEEDFPASSEFLIVCHFLIKIIIIGICSVLVHHIHMSI
jgi:hypothetical protein